MSGVGCYSVGRGKGRGKHNREEVHGIPDPKWFMIGRSERGLAYGVFVGIRAPMFFPKIQGSPPAVALAKFLLHCPAPAR